MSYKYERFECFLRLWMGIFSSHSHRYHHRRFPRFEKVGWNPTLCKCANHVTTHWLRFKLHPMSMSYIYEVFEHLCRLWMGKWLHIGIDTTIDASPHFGELAETLPYGSVQTMPLRIGWSCRTFQTASHINVIHICGVWAPSQVVDSLMASHSHRYHHRCFPRSGNVGWNPTWCKCAHHVNTFRPRL